MHNKTLAIVHLKRRRLIVDLYPRYWALGFGLGKTNYHVQLGPLGVSLSKRRG
jgi:hypothetical protein